MKLKTKLVIVFLAVMILPMIFMTVAVKARQMRSSSCI